jgi:hypothetical protein
MRRRRGRLPGRYVPAHVRKWPHRPGEYVEVSDYQEHIDPPASRVEAVPKQGELALAAEESDDEKREE